MKVGVVGLGYVGLPVALVAALSHDVIGVDIDAGRVTQLQARECPITGQEPGLADLLSATTARFTDDYRALSDRELVVVAVPTPVSELTHLPDYSYLTAACGDLSQVLPPGTIVVIESTVGPGTCARCQQLLPRLRVAHCPERVMPGRLLANLRTLDRVLGVNSRRVAETLLRFYGTMTTGEVVVTSLVNAELAKLFENTYRDVNIAFANEAATICERYGADVWEVRALVNHCPGRLMLEPGAGVGGHCLPKDPWLLTLAMPEMRLIRQARAVNESAPRHVALLLYRAWYRLGLDPQHARAVILGRSYLPESDDVSGSPGEQLRDLLNVRGAAVELHDPYTAPGDLYALANGADALVLVTAHRLYADLDFQRLRAVMQTPLLIDGRGLWRNDPPPGFEYVLLGKGKK